LTFDSRATFLLSSNQIESQLHLFFFFFVISTFSWLYNIFRWSNSCTNMLRTAEKQILRYLKSPYRGFFIDIGPCVGEADKIWTIALNETSEKVPLVLLHGLGAGSALWVLNYDQLARDRPVYAIDLLGFGRSSRPDFAKDSEMAEKQFVRSIEEWRKEVNIKKMVLCGHSFGGYLGCSYALTHPDRVEHLVLADAWGMPERPADPATKYNAPLWVKAVAYAVQPLNPLWAVRAAGPFGQWVVEKTRPDIMRKYSAVVKDDTLIPQYIYQCNVQSPTGESAFHSMMSGFGWAKSPMINRIHEIRADVPMTLIYGSRSWVDNAAGNVIKASRPNSYVSAHIINQAGHHVYADKAEEFNRLVRNACRFTEDGKICDDCEDAEE